MTRTAHLLVLWIALACAFDARAFDTATHAQVLSRQAATRSVLQTDPTVLRAVGLEKGMTDVTQTFPDSGGLERTVRDLIEHGAVFEDTSITVIPPNHRSTRHFYNPITGAGMNEGIFSNQTPSPGWALAPRGTLANQEFSYWDARQYLYDALTKPGATDRKRAFGSTFQSIGQVIHHLQDMAQPQHVRNDVHCSVFLLCDLVGLRHAPSFFERWTNRPEIRALITQRHTDPGTVGYNITGADFRTVFNTPRRFWHTEQPGPGSPQNGQGIAEFTNRNFVSAGTNFDRPGLFALPAFNPGRKSEPTAGELCSNPNVTPACPSVLTTEPYSQARITFYEADGHDNFLREPFVTTRASTESIFDEELRVQGERPIFALNRFNFDEAYRHLIPRAVAFSAGMINYFFRGRIDLLPDPQNPAQRFIKNFGTESMKGKFALYYDNLAGVRGPVLDAGGQALVWDTELLLPDTQGVLAAGASFPAGEIAAPADAKTKGDYMLVFSGEMGQEKPENGGIGAVVGQAVTNPYAGVLYLAGHNAAGQLQFFKVDKNGVSSASGQGPFVFGYVDNGVRERSHHYKQAHITTLPNGTVVHKTVGFAARTGQLGFLSDMSMSLNPSTGVLQSRGQFSWTAASLDPVSGAPDPAIGTFQFILEINDSPGNSAHLLYNRRFVNAQGQTVVTEGFLPLPHPAPLGYTYRAFAAPANTLQATGRLFISRDGTRIYPRGVTGSTISQKGVQITLGAVPSVTFFDLPQGTSSSEPISPVNIFAPTGNVCTVDYLAANPSGGPFVPSTFVGEELLSEQLQGGTSTSSGTTYEEIFKGELLSYRTTFTFASRDHRRQVSCVAAAADWSTGQPQVKVNLQFTRHIEQSGSARTDYLLPGGGAVTHLSEGTLVATGEVRPVGCGLTAGLHGPQGGASLPSPANGTPLFDATYSYQGFGPCPPMHLTSYNSVPAVTEKKRLHRALTDDAADAVYTDELDPGFYRFRSARIPAISGFVADTSPLGEVFFAAPDLSFIHHKPGPGNMPELTRDMIPNLVRVLAAFWL